MHHRFDNYALAKAMSNNSMDVRAKQRLCYLACLLNSELRGGGFAPRHLNRYMLCGENQRDVIIHLKRTKKFYGKFSTLL